VVIWIAAILLIAAVALFVAAPLTDHEPAYSILATNNEPERRIHEHALAVQALRELEFDYAMGKLDLDDYRALRLRLEARALASMAEQEKELRGSSLLSAAASRRTSVHSVALNFCSECGAKMDPHHNFCPTCGRARASLRETKGAD
jgi:cytochrome c-type biogenesis protein CcmI